MFNWLIWSCSGVLMSQEMSTHMLPGFSKGSAPSTSDLHYSPTTAGTPLSLTTNGHQPAVAHTADESQVSDKAVYAVINHRQAGMPAREQRTLTAQDKNSAYAAISVSWTFLICHRQMQMKMWIEKYTVPKYVMEQAYVLSDRPRCGGRGLVVM